MIKRRLKTQYLLLFVSILLVLPLVLIGIAVQTSLNEVVVEEPDYVPEETFNHYVPVINTETRVINPFHDPSVTIGKNYYDYKADEENQKKAIIEHDNTYIQNTGIDYISNKEFEVLSVLDGTVLNTSDDESLGKIIEIKHENGLVTSYQSLGKINVKKGDIVTQGQVIGTSGTNELDKSLGNHLHFEIYDNGQAMNPDNYLNKELKNEKGN